METFCEAKFGKKEFLKDSLHCGFAAFARETDDRFFPR